MKRLQLPKNKFARLGINIVLIVVWFIFYCFVIWQIQREILWFLKLNPFNGFVELINWFFIIAPMFLISRYVWFGRIKPRARITRSKD